MVDVSEMNINLITIKNSFLTGILALACLFLLCMHISPALAANHKSNSTLVIGVHPYLPPAELKKRFTPLLKYLSNLLAISMELSVSKDYETHIENIGNKLFDMAYLGPASYVSLIDKYGPHPLLSRLEIKGKPYFKGYIVTKNDSDILELKHLKGKSFAFGSPRSTMSYLVPRFMLREAGVSLESLSDYKFQGNHRNVALSVLLGEFAAGAVKEEVYFKFKDKGLRQIAASPSISEHVFLCRQGLSLEKHKKIQNAMYSLSKTENGRQILKSIKKNVSGLVPVSDKDYDNLRAIIR